MRTPGYRNRAQRAQPPQRRVSRPSLTAALILVGFLAPGTAAAQAANNPGTGDTGFFTFRPAEGVGGTQINVASGNALIRVRDLADGLPTYHVVVDRAYNSLLPDVFSILSPRWKFGVGPDTKLTVESNQDATVVGPSGYLIRFARQTDGTYVAPQGFDGTLTKTSTGWTLTRTSQGDEFGFDNSGTLTWTKDNEARDFTVQGTSAAGRTVLSSYGTNSGRRVNLSYTGDSLVRLMDDPASGHHYYRYTAGRLTQYESPTGAITTYGYDANGFLNSIAEPGGTTVALDVLAASGKVNSITTTPPGGLPQTTSFVYTRRTYKSDVIAPDAVRRTYAYDDDWRVTRQYNPDEIPSVTATGELRNLEGGYVGPNRVYPVTVAATQPDGAGLRRLWLALSSEAELDGEDVPCTTTPFDLVCPQTFDVPLSIDFSPLPEGPTTIHGAARDDEENRGNSTPWEVTVDKTAPVNVSASGELFDLPEYTTGEGTATVTASALDPSMADGTRLSGIKSLKIEDVGHGIIAERTIACPDEALNRCDVEAAEQLTVDLAQMAEGRHTLRVVATDAVGNEATSTPWSFTIDRTPPTISFSGNLYDLRNIRVLENELRNLVASAVDGNSSGTDAEKRSGVAWVGVEFAGEFIGGAEAPAPGVDALVTHASTIGAPSIEFEGGDDPGAEDTWADLDLVPGLDPSNDFDDAEDAPMENGGPTWLAPGQYNVTIVAVDHLGHTAVDHFTIDM